MAPPTQCRKSQAKADTQYSQRTTTNEALVVFDKAKQAANKQMAHRLHN